jgi:hypothetical protein
MKRKTPYTLADCVRYRWFGDVHIIRRETQMRTSSIFDPAKQQLVLPFTVTVNFALSVKATKVKEHL